MRNVRIIHLAGLVALISACTVASEPTRRVALRDGSNSNSAGTVFSCDDPTDACFSFDGTPPPPFLDTTGSFSAADGSALGAATLRVQYFMNKTDNNGWVAFKGQTSTDVLASANARISVHQGAVSGKGTLSLALPGSAVLSFDLSKAVSGKSVFNGDCSRGCATLLMTGTLTLKVGRTSAFSAQLLIAPPPGDIIIGDRR